MRPNIFDYAKKELSQDAVVCWLLNCCHSAERTYKTIGLDFIRFILDDESINENNTELEKNSPHAQYYHMDVYANIRVGNEIIPVIFEDKTDTFLHGEQEKRYTETVNSWKNNEKWTKGLFDSDKLTWSKNTRYVFFKTGYVFDWQKDEVERLKDKINAEVRTCYIDDMIGFIKKHKDKDLLLADYYDHLLKRRSALTGCIEEKCNRYFNKIFGDRGCFKWNYQQWAARSIGYIGDESKKSENTINYVIRSGWRKNDGETMYFIAFQQYRNEKTLYGSREKKKLLTEQRYEITYETRDICKIVADELGVEIKLKDNSKNRMPDQNNIFIMFINDGNEDDVCGFFKSFIERFNILAKERLKEYVIC